MAYFLSGAYMMLRLAFGRPWRQTEGMLGSIIDLLGLDLPVPDHTTFSRHSADMGVATALKKASGPVHVVIDSTGLKVFGAGMAPAKRGGGPRRSWRKLHLAVDPDSGGILASELTTTATPRWLARCSIRLTARSPRCLLRRIRWRVGLPLRRRPHARRRGDHSPQINRSAERHGRNHPTQRDRHI